MVFGIGSRLLFLIGGFILAYFFVKPFKQK